MKNEKDEEPIRTGGLETNGLGSESVIGYLIQSLVTANGKSP
jgi:hypothetical protein